MTFALQEIPGFAYRKHEKNLHKNVFRQLRTVLEWRNSYFPGRPLPRLFERWAQYFFNQRIARQRYEELDDALEYSSELRDLYNQYHLSRKFRVHAFTRLLRRRLGMNDELPFLSAHAESVFLYVFIAEMVGNPPVFKLRVDRFLACAPPQKFFCYFLFTKSSLSLLAS